MFGHENDSRSVGNNGSVETTQAAGLCACTQSGASRGAFGYDIGCHPANTSRFVQDGRRDEHQRPFEVAGVFLSKIMLDLRVALFLLFIVS